MLKADIKLLTQTAVALFAILLILPVAADGSQAGQSREPNAQPDGFAGLLREVADHLEQQKAPDPCDNDQPVQEPLSIAVLQVSGHFVEKPGVSMFSLSDSSANTLIRFTQTLTRAAGDEDIEAVLFNFERPLLSWAHVDELRRLIGKLRDSGKKTYAYVETFGRGDYLLACACDEIIMTPTGSLMLTGLAGEALYFKNLLDMIGVDADFMQMGCYKSAAEGLTRTGPSQPNLQQMNRLFDSLYGHLIDSIAFSRDISPAQVAKIIDEGPFTARQAKEAGLIDRVMYRRDFLRHLKQRAGTEITLKKNYNQTGRKDINFDNPFAMISILQELFNGPKEPSGEAVAVVYIDGVITQGQNSEGLTGGATGSRTIRMVLDEASRDNDIKAIVVRINSPGGGATASDIIYHAIRNIAQTKPVVVSMGSVAGSGGYYVACGGETILAEASSITGSIGVVGGKIVLGGLLEKLGINSYTFKRGQNADMFSSTGPFSPMQRMKVTGIMRDIYETFKNCVAKSRGQKLKDTIENLAQGKVYTGLQAKELGLIDQIGGLDDAVKLAAEKAGIQTYHIRSLPRPKSVFDMLDEMFSAGPPLAQIAHNRNFGSDQRKPPEVQFDLLLPRDKLLLYKIHSYTYGLIKLLRQEQTLFILPYEFIID